jgi:type I restriction enzyme S subunit
MRANVPLGEVCHVVMGQAPSGASYNQVGEGLPLIAGAGDFGEIYPKPKKFTREPTNVANSGDIIICIRATIGDLNLADRQVCLGRGVAGLRPKNGKLNSRYLWHWLSYNNPNLEKLGKGSTFKQVTRGDIAGQLISVLPEPEQQKRVAAILDKADAVRRKRRQALAEINVLLRSAYQYLVSSQNPNFSEWNLRKFEELAANRRGAMRTGPFGSDLKHSEFVDRGIAVLGIDNAVSNRFTWGERRFITHEKYEGLRRYRALPGDVIVTIMGTTGRSAVVRDDIPEAITTKHLATISLETRLALPEFVAFAIHSDPKIVAQIEQANKGAIMDGLNLSIIKKLEIALPPIEDQRHFAEVYQKLHFHKARLASPEASGDALFESLSQRAFRGEL